jgi:hypothetical protein
METVTSRSSRRPKTRKELSRAELKAYEARRADERKRIGTGSVSNLEVGKPVSSQVEHSFAMNRDEEFTVIKADLYRLLIILAAISVLMIVLTILLR